MQVITKAETKQQALQIVDEVQNIFRLALRDEHIECLWTTNEYVAEERDPRSDCRECSKCNDRQYDDAASCIIQAVTVIPNVLKRGNRRLETPNGIDGIRADAMNFRGQKFGLTHHVFHEHQDNAKLKDFFSTTPPSIHEFSCRNGTI